MDFIIVSLGAKLKEIEGDKVKEQSIEKALSLFKCKKNLDEQKFINQEAIFFERHNKARTYLLIRDDTIIAYFSIAFKSIDLVTISKNKKKSLTGGEQVNTYSSYLIGHLAKDDSIEEKMLPILLDNAMSLIYEAQSIVGGRLVYLDCKNEPKLIKMYEEYGFEYFGTSKETNLRQYYLKI